MSPLGGILYFRYYTNKSWVLGKNLFVRVGSAAFLSMVPQHTQGEVSHNWGLVLMSWILIIPWLYIWLNKPASGQLLMLLQKHQRQRHFTSLNWHWLKVNLLTYLSLLWTNCTRYQLSCGLILYCRILNELRTSLCVCSSSICATCLWLSGCSEQRI